MPGIQQLLAATGGAAAFNPATAISWDTLFYASSAPSHGSDNTASDWKDVGGTKTLTSAAQAIYHATGFGTNSRPYWGGNGTAAYLQWARASALAQPYTVFMVGQHASALTDYSVLVADATTQYWFNWVVKDTTLYEAFEMSSLKTMPYNYDANANCWYAFASASASRFGKNGIAQRQTLSMNPHGGDTDAFNGLTLFRYPTSGAYYSAGKLAFVGVFAGDLVTDPQYLNLLKWVETYYGINTTNRNNIIVSGASRADGAEFFSGEGGQFGKIWPYVMQGTFAASSVATVTVGYPNTTQDVVNGLSSALVDDNFTESPSTKTKICLCHCDAALNSITADNRTAVQAYAQIVTFVAARQAAGELVMVMTQPGYTALTAPQETARLLLNAYITTNGVNGGVNSVSGANADRIFDLANDANVINNPMNATNTPANFVAGGPHFTVAGNAYVAGVVYTDIGTWRSLT